MSPSIAKRLHLFRSEEITLEKRGTAALLFAKMKIVAHSKGRHYCASFAP